MPAPGIEIEGLALLMTVDEAIARCTANGWDHTFGSAAGRATIAPGRPVLPLAAKVEVGRIVSLEATYEPADPARAAAPLAQLPIARDGVLLARPWRAAWAADRSIVIVAQGDGRSVIGMHLGAIHDPREVRAYLASYGAGLEPPARGGR
jgi:hypothetical protein